MLSRLRQRLGALPREARDTLFLLAVIAWVILPHAGRLPAWCSLGVAAVLTWRGRLAWRGGALPGRWWLLGLLALAVGATWLHHGSLLGRDGGVTLVVALLALKTLELRARRDALVVFFLGFFTLLTHFFFSQSLVLAVAMGVGLLGLLTALVNAHLPVGRPPLAASAGVAGRLLLLGAPVMAVLFVLFPRFAPLWGLPGDGMAGRSGLSAQMEVGSIATLALDDAVALRVRFEGPPPGASDLYWRGPVLSVFDGRQWRPLGRNGQRVAPAMLGPAQLRTFGAPVRYEATLEPHHRPWLLVLDAAAAPPEAERLRPLMTRELEWLAPQPVTELLRYRVASHVDFRHGPARRAGVLPEYTQLPPGRNPRTLQWAAELARAAPEPAAVVQAALARLREGGYRYTLEPGVYGEETADEFWFDRREGFCEHIASAFVVLMRAAGLPARLVTGYQGGQLNPVDGWWVVRQRDAHAWAEVWLEGRGWVRVDPTAAVAPGRTGALRLQAPRGVLATAIDTLDPTLAGRLRDAWDALNNGWNQWVLNYTQGRQLRLLQGLGFHAPTWVDLGWLLLMLLGLGAAAGAGWSWWDRRPHDPWLRLLAQARRRLAAAGLDSGPASTPRELSAQVRLRFGNAAAAVADWLLRLEQQRYSGASVPGLPELQREFHLLAWPRAPRCAAGPAQPSGLAGPGPLRQPPP